MVGEAGSDFEGEQGDKACQFTSLDEAKEDEVLGMAFDSLSEFGDSSEVGWADPLLEVGALHERADAEYEHCDVGRELPDTFGQSDFLADREFRNTGAGVKVTPTWEKKACPYLFVKGTRPLL